MINISWKVLVVSFLLFFVSSYSVADEFGDFVVNQQKEIAHSQQDFSQYKQKVEREFEVYRKIVNEEYERYKNDILKYWDIVEVTGKKKWVEYSSDFKTKRVVDFEKGFIELNIIFSKKEKDIERTFEKVLTDLLVEDKQTAFQRDSLAQNIEKRITKEAKHIKTDSIEKAPVLATIITGTPKPTKKEIKRAVSILRKKGEVKRKPSKVKHADVVTLRTPLPPKSIQKKAQEYKHTVKAFAEKRNIDDALIFAVIHTESAFNPMARSHVPAYGLMQIVPHSAGKDASEVVYGRQILLSPSYLYNGKNNINMGTTYLYILFTKYLKEISNHQSRLYCTIAAYNTGAGNVARAFAGKNNISKAAKVINSMTPEEVYKRLLRKLPYDETKQYLKKVSQRMEIYKTL